MTVGLPIPFSFQESNVIDPTQVLNDLLINCQVPIFSKGLELQSSDAVYSYEDDIDFTPRLWDAARQDAGDYNMDEILFVPCDIDSGSVMYPYAGKLIKVTGRDGSGVEKHERPSEPEEYGSYDEGHMNWRTFTQRYWRTPAMAQEGVATGGISRTWTDDDRWYYFFYEDRGGCGPDSWRWSAKDRSCPFPRHFTDYLRTCLHGNVTTKYDAAKDIPGKTYYWEAPNTTRGRKHTYQFRSAIIRNGYFYFRTHINAQVKYQTWVTGVFDYSFMEVTGPEDIDGFVFKRNVNAFNPFDGKGYTSATIDTTETNGVAVWKLLATDEFNTIAFGAINANSMNIKIEDEDGLILFELNNYLIFNEIDAEDATSFLDSGLEYQTTIVIYTPEMMNSEVIITVSIFGDVIELGELIGAKSVDAGFTNVAFKNSLKDFSPKEQDQWGNWYYTNGVKVSVHSGTVEFPIVRYDQLNRLMKLIGGQKVVINSSDSFENQTADGRSIFNATMLIGRFTKFELDSSSKNKTIGDTGKYNFNIEEIT